MTDVAPLTSNAELQSQLNATAVGSASDDTRSNATTDYDDFLTLLVAQMENQDPLNPTDGTEFVAQLAQFSGLEQQISTNDKLDELIGSLSGDELTELAGWIGQEVRALDVGFSFEGDPLTIDVPGDAEATTASMVIRNESGREVRTITANPGGGPLTWDGATNSGETAAEGVYKIEFVYGYGFEGQNNPPPSRTVPAEAFGLVREARLDRDGGVLILENGAVVNPGSMTAVRAPDPTNAE